MKPATSLQSVAILLVLACQSLFLRPPGAQAQVTASLPSVQRLTGVKSVDVNLKTGLLEIVLAPGNTFKMSNLRKRIRENGFRSMEATITALGDFDSSSKFEVLGTGEAYDVPRPAAKAPGAIEFTFTAR